MTTTDPFVLAADMMAPKSAVRWRPEPHQIPPEGKWRGWLLIGGRGSGKTAASAKYVHDHVHGPPCLPDVPGGHWISIVAPTLGDAVTSCVTGPSGLRVHQPGVRVVNRPGGVSAIWPNGTEAKLFGAHSPEDVERFRAGGNRCLVWMEELAAWRYLEESFQQIRYGLRVGPWPRWIGSTTPKARPTVKAMWNNPRIAKTFATTEDNPHLDASVKAELYEDYGGTRMGRQELQGELLEDVEGALWTGDIIERSRIKRIEMPEFLDRITVAIDPAAKSTETSDETGIVTVGMVRYWDAAPDHPEKSHGFVFDDVSGTYLPSEWARKAIHRYRLFKANRVTGEINNGGEMVKHTIHSIDDTIPFFEVTATRGKTRRAEPISALWAEGRMHIVGILPRLEDQMTTWDPQLPDEFSPDRMDAMVWGATDLMVGPTTLRKKRLTDHRLRGRR